jgi:predicted  nucleic acid-binding Zn-ribbon protein
MTGQEPAKVIDRSQDWFRRIDAKLDRIIDDLSDLKVRMSLVEMGLANVQQRLDRMDGRLDRIERRLELRENGEPAA